MFWTANSKFNFVKSDGAQNVWRKEGEAFKLSCIRGTVKFGGGNVMVWESMTWNGTRKLELIDEIMGSEVYVKILNKNLQASTRKLQMGKLSSSNKTPTPSILQRKKKSFHPEEGQIT